MSIQTLTAQLQAYHYIYSNSIDVTCLHHIHDYQQYTAWHEKLTFNFALSGV